jgi:hypothetical protein
MKGGALETAQPSTPSKPPRNRRPRARHPSGIYTLKGVLARVADEDWTEALGPVGEALRSWRRELIDSLGGDTTVTPQQRSLVELATRTHLMVESVDRFILGMPSLVNKSKRSIFAVVRERQQLADALARYLSLLGLERRSREMAFPDRLRAALATRSTTTSTATEIESPGASCEASAGRSGTE